MTNDALVRLALLLSLCVSSVARADGDVAGFVTLGTGDLSGQVTTLDGKPAKKIVVHVVTSADQELRLTTDDSGRYKAALSGGDVAYVYVEGKLRIGGQTVGSVKEGDGEAIAIREALPPSVPAKPKSERRIVPEYSKAADDKNTWARAWLLLHVSETGQVMRVKLINKPGLDLDPIAVREAFKLGFEPARDRTNRKIASMVLWTFEWPASWWLAENQHGTDELPDGVQLVECRVPNSKKRYTRDCTPPNIVNAFKTPWIERPKAK